MRRIHLLIAATAAILLTITGCSSNASPNESEAISQSPAPEDGSGAVIGDGIAEAPEQEVTTSDAGKLRVDVTVGGEQTQFTRYDDAWRVEDFERMRLLVLSANGFWTGLFAGPTGTGEINRAQDSKTMCDPDRNYAHGADCVTGISFDPAGWLEGPDDAKCYLSIQFEGVFGFGEQFWFVDAEGNRYLEDATYDDVISQGESGLPCNGATPAS